VIKQSRHDFDSLLNPKSIAIFGSFKEGIFGGYPAVRQLQSFGFSGKIYPINPRYNEVLGIKVYPSVNEIPTAVDLAVIMTAATTVPEIMEQCAKRGIKAAVVVSDGFAERNEEGAELQRKFVDIAKKAGMRIIGPNTAGIVNIKEGFALGAYECGYEKIKKGTISFITQTGIIALQAVPWADFPYGINKFIDLGNKCDVDESELLEYLGNDPETKVISLYLEGIKDGQRFLKAAKEITRRKPVLVLKSGRTKEAAKAIVSHTGSLAGDDQVFDSACQQANIIRVSKWNELFDFAKILAYQPLPKGNRLGILSCTGGVATMLIDTAAEWGLTIAKLSAESSDQLKKLFPPAWGANPIDWGIPTAYMPDKWFPFYQQALETLLKDDNIDCIANVIWIDPFGSSVDAYTKLAEELQGTLTKPIATWIYSPSSSHVMELSYRLESLGFPVFHDHETAAKALGIMFRYSTIKDNSL